MKDSEKTWEEFKRIAREHPIRVVVAQQHPRPLYSYPRAPPDCLFCDRGIPVIFVDYPSLTKI